MLAPFSVALMSRDPTSIEEAIRYALRAAALMASRFGRTPSSVIYSANAMRFYTSDRLGAIETWSEQELRLYPEGHRGDRICGALVFDPRESTSSSSARAHPLEGMGPLRIIIPDPPRDRSPDGTREGNLRVLPGCATAFIRGGPFIATDTWNMRSYREGHFVAEEVLSASDRYLRTTANGVRSFVSIPVKGPGKEDVTVGVLNVEMTEPNIFGGDERTVRNFARAIAPVLFVIEMLWKLADESRPPSGSGSEEAFASASHTMAGDL